MAVQPDKVEYHLRRNLLRAALSAPIMAVSSLWPAVEPVASAGASQKPEQDRRRFEGVWRMLSYSRNGQKLEWDGMMILTRTFFSRNYMARKRPMFSGEFETRSDLSVEEKDKVVEALVRGFAGDSGTYRIENDRLLFDIDVAKVPSNVGRRGSWRQYAFEKGNTHLLLKGARSSGITVEEVWEKVE